MTEPVPRWQALLVGVASSLDPTGRGFTQSLNSQLELARVLSRNMPGLARDDLTVLPEPWHAHEITDKVGELNEQHDAAGTAELSRPGLLFYYCGHGLTHEDGTLYLSTVETIDSEVKRRRTGLALSELLATIYATEFKRRPVILILDCCFAGLARAEPAAERVHLLMAVGPKVKATHAPNGVGPTHFTGALVELLRTGDPGAGEWIDLETAYQWMARRLVDRYDETRRPYQQPAGDSGAIILGRNPAWSGPAA
jgi:Caspase domain